MSASNSTLPQHVQQRNRSIAEREASRLARPDRPQAQSIGHANRSKSAVSSTPFGFDTFKRRHNNTANGVDNDSHDQDRQHSHIDDWCGPFSVARQMIAQREEARRQREEERLQQQETSNNDANGTIIHPLDEIAKQVEFERKRKAHPSMTWKPKNNQKLDNNKDTLKPNLYYKRQRRIQKQQQLQKTTTKIPSLFQLCVQYIVQNFENVESLGYTIDNSIRKAICEELVSKQKMNGAAFDILAEEGVEILDIVDCTNVTSDQMAQTLDVLIPSGLRALLLTHAGRCFTSKAVDAIVKHHHDHQRHRLIQLFALSISGAYCLKDIDIARLISVTAPTLSSIQLKACPLIGLEFCTSIATHYSSTIGSSGSCLLELNLEDIPSLSKDHLLHLSSSDALTHLKSLTLKQMDNAIDDDVIYALLSSITSGNLEGINLSNNIHLTDGVLSIIRKYNTHGQLKSLQLSGLKNLTSAGLETFFTFDIPGLPTHPPSLKTLDLSDCDVDAVTASVVTLAITASAAKRYHGTTTHATPTESTSEITTTENTTTKNDTNNVSTLGGIVSLDVSGSSVNDDNMENLALYCHESLRELKINFCPSVSDKGLGYLVSKAKHQLHRIEIWGCAQITDTFLDGHSRVDEVGGSGLEIIGAWMSKGSSSSNSIM